MGQHHAFRLGGGSRGVDNHRDVVRLGNARRTLLPYALRNDAEVLRADHDVEPFDGRAGEFGEEFVGNQQGLGLGVLDNHVELLARKIGQDRHGNHAGRGHGEIADAPVGHVAAQQGHLVPGAESRTGQYFLHLGNTKTRLGVSHVFAFEHREGDFRRELLHAVAGQFVQCIDRHNVFTFMCVQITQKYGAKLLNSS